MFLGALLDQWLSEIIVEACLGLLSSSLLKLGHWSISGHTLWHIISHDLLHDDPLGLLLLWLVTSHEVREEGKSSWRVSRFDVSVEVSGHLGQHLQIGKCDHILLKEQEVNTKGDIHNKHYWAEVVVAVVVLSMVVFTTVMLSVVLTMLSMVII